MFLTLPFSKYYNVPTNCVALTDAGVALGATGSASENYHHRLLTSSPWSSLRPQPNSFGVFPLWPHDSRRGQNEK